MNICYPLDIFCDINSSQLNKTICRIEKTTQNNMNLMDTSSIFDNTDEEASITFTDYIERFVMYTHTTFDLLADILVILDRFLRINNIAIKKNNKYRLFASAFVCTYKFYSDKFHSNRTLAKIAGLPLDELNKLELEFLFKINFNLFVSS